MLERFSLSGIGPGTDFDLELGPRLTLITADNALSTTVPLDLVWWTLARSWPTRLQLPESALLLASEVDGKGTGAAATRRPDAVGSGVIDYRIVTQSGARRDGRCRYHPRPPQPLESWWQEDGDGLLWRDNTRTLVYARTDGGFSLYFPAGLEQTTVYEFHTAAGRPFALHMSEDEVWHGARRAGHKMGCNGLFQDWWRWLREEPATFERFQRVVNALAPDDEPITLLSEPLALRESDYRTVPIVRLPYGRTPVYAASAGVRRVLALAYMILWPRVGDGSGAIGKRRWTRPSDDRIMVLIDELGTHLNPAWCRALASALLAIGAELGVAEKLQFLVTAKTEAIADGLRGRTDADKDRLLRYEVAPSGAVVLESASG